MADFLTINGVALAVRRDTFRVERLEVGPRIQAFDGTPIVAVRAVRRRLTLETPPLSQDDATFWAELLGPRSMSCHFDTDTYSDQGHVATTAGTVAVSGTHLELSAATGSYAQWAVGTFSDWTVSLRRYTSGDGWQSYVIRSDGAKWVDGTRNDGASSAWLSYSAGNLKVAGVAGGATEFACLVFVPGVCPDAVPAQWHAYYSAAGYSLLPRVDLGGDCLPEAIECVGQVTASKVIPCAISGGAMVANCESLSLDLIEV